MSSALVDVTVIHREGARVRFRCRDLHDADSVSVTRSFVVLMLSISSPDGETTPGMRRAAALHGLAEPISAEEAGPVFAPWIDTVIRTTRIVSRAKPLADTHEETVRLLGERAGDPTLTWESLHAMPPRRARDLLAEVCGHYVLEVDFATEALASEVKVGWVFDTYAHDVWWSDPENPLASAAERAEWSVSAAAMRRPRENAEDGVTEWLAAAEKKQWIEVRARGRERLEDAMLARLQRGHEDDELRDDTTDAIVELLFDHDDVEEVFANDDELRTSIARLVDRVRGV